MYEELMEFIDFTKEDENSVNTELFKIYPIYREYLESNEYENMPFFLWFEIKGYTIENNKMVIV